MSINSGMPLTQVVGPGMDGIAGVYVHVKFQNDPDPRKLHVFVGNSTDAFRESAKLQEMIRDIGPITLLEIEVVPSLVAPEALNETGVQFFQWRLGNGKTFTMCSVVPSETFDTAEQTEVFKQAVARNNGEVPTRLEGPASS